MHNSIELSQDIALLFFAVYVVIAVVIGLVCAQRESEDDFMIAGRRVRGLQMIATVTAGIFDGAVLSIYIAYVYQYGMSAMWFFVGLSLGFIIFRHFAGRIKDRADKIRAYSMPEYFFTIYGRRTGLMFSLFLIVQFFGYLTVNFILSGKVLVKIFPSLPYSLCVGVGAAIILTYLVMAGFKAVVKTDFYQLLIMIVMCVTVWLALGRGHEIASSDMNFPAMGVGNILGFLILSAFGILVAPDLWQRAFAAENKKTLRAGFAYGALILPVLALVITVVGLTTRHEIPGVGAENALVTGFAVLLPHGIKEAGMVLLYAVALSSSDTVTFVVSSIISRDLKNYTAKYNDESARKLTRIFMVAFVMIAMSVAAAFQNILALAFALASLNLALFPVVFASFYWKLKESAVFWSLIFTFVGVGAIAATRPLTPETAALSFPLALFSLIVLQLFWRKKSPEEKELGSN
jgi:SSS family solute:Na+ symporter